MERIIILFLFLIIIFVVFSIIRYFENNNAKLNEEINKQKEKNNAVEKSIDDTVSRNADVIDRIDEFIGTGKTEGK